jgi:hypothetical protein
MNLNSYPAEPARLETLAYQARDYALHMMHHGQRSADSDCRG